MAGPVIARFETEEDVERARHALLGAGFPPDWITVGQGGDTKVLSVTVADKLEQQSATDVLQTSGAVAFETEA